MNIVAEAGSMECRAGGQSLKIRAVGQRQEDHRAGQQKTQLGAGRDSPLMTWEVWLDVSGEGRLEV